MLCLFYIYIILLLQIRSSWVNESFSKHVIICFLIPWKFEGEIKGLIKIFLIVYYFRGWTGRTWRDYRNVHSAFVPIYFISSFNIFLFCLNKFLFISILSWFKINWMGFRGHPAGRWVSGHLGLVETPTI